jgi:hypothetical protein
MASPLNTRTAIVKNGINRSTAPDGRSRHPTSDDECKKTRKAPSDDEDHTSRDSAV